MRRLAFFLALLQCLLVLPMPAQALLMQTKATSGQTSMAITAHEGCAQHAATAPAKDSAPAGQLPVCQDCQRCAGCCLPTLPLHPGSPVLSALTPAASFAQLSLGLAGPPELKPPRN